MTLLTRWGRDLDLDAVLPEYPRPQPVRDGHLKLPGRLVRAVNDRLTSAGAPPRPIP
ncbi:hypothetical protein [Actinomadura violacea]|uniref:Uncharacterized protein n=1 Tax=Actinomadura violacea TaxID=2819934 RepID=A0ABS3RZU1_9ACTN|nr:hypothetical protein [Actinomadura violacea]MBO2462269.1 hypothetical protein [Actinomadura violacea]